MTQALLYRGLALACLAGLGLGPTPGAAAQPAEPRVQLAADARNPYGNINRQDDAGNDTGDAQVDRLNEGQLDRNYRGPYQQMPPRGYAGPPPGYAGPPPGYGAPPPGYGGQPQIYAPPLPSSRPPGY